jgi:hypothetical protein
MTTLPHSPLEAHHFPVAWVQNTQKLADNSPALDEAVDDCKIASSLAIAAVPLSVNRTHASKLLRI